MPEPPEPPEWYGRALWLVIQLIAVTLAAGHIILTL